MCCLHIQLPYYFLHFFFFALFHFIILFTFGIPIKLAWLAVHLAGSFIIADFRRTKQARKFLSPALLCLKCSSHGRNVFIARVHRMQRDLGTGIASLRA